MMQFSIYHLNNSTYLNKGDLNKGDLNKGDPHKGDPHKGERRMTSYIQVQFSESHVCVCFGSLISS